MVVLPGADSHVLRARVKPLRNGEQDRLMQDRLMQDRLMQDRLMQDRLMQDRLMKVGWRAFQLAVDDPSGTRLDLQIRSMALPTRGERRARASVGVAGAALG
jgi:hypothetical protein